MALITVTGTIKDPSGGFLSEGTIVFALDEYLIASGGYIVPKQEKSATINSKDGTFSIALESTADATPATRKYAVLINGKKESRLGDITLGNSPSSQNLKDLLSVAATTEMHRDKEIPVGAVDDSNKIFTLANVPVAGSEMVFVNGILQTDYTIVGAVITFTLPLLTGDLIRVSYRSP